MQYGHFRWVRRMKNGGVWRRLAGSLLGTRQIYLCGAVRAVMHQGSSPAAATFAGIAQLAVRITCNDEVIGSTPIASSC